MGLDVDNTLCGQLLRRIKDPHAGIRGSGWRQALSAFMILPDGSRLHVSYAKVRVMQKTRCGCCPLTCTDRSRRPRRPALAAGFA
jgi:hypothetical protein